MKRLQQHCSLFFLLALSLAGADKHFSSRVRKAVLEKRSQDNYRLPGHVVPTHYEVKLRPDIYGDPSTEDSFGFQGWVTIHVQCLQATDVIVLHQDRLTMESADISVTKDGDQTELFSSYSYERKRHFLSLHLTRSLEVGKNYVVNIRSFSGPLRADGQGLYLSYYMEGNNKVYLVASQLEAVFARKVFPCFDEPHLKATFDVKIMRLVGSERQYTSLSNAPLADSTVVEYGYWIEDRFERTPKMSTYLLAFIMSDFPSVESYTSTQPPVKFRTFAPPALMDSARKVHESGLKLFEEVNQYFKPQYSDALTKLDNVWLPQFKFGGMENWGLITYNTQALPQAAFPQMPLITNALLVHEFAHQWFGNYVSPKWWKWAWLNEAFAYWWDVHITQKAFPGWKVTQEWLATDVQQIMNGDANAQASHSLEVMPTSPASIKTSFDAFVNKKGASLVRMMQFVMGADAFVEALNTYLTRYKYNSAESSDLFGVLDEKMKALGHGEHFMSTRMSPWFSQAGLPLVRVSRTTSGFRLTQTQFLAGSDTGNNKWDIPITYATSEDTNMVKSSSDVRWLRKDSALEIQVASVSWILVNIDQIAYCHVLYDTDVWNALIAQLNSDHTVISAINRGQIINDAWTLSKHDVLPLSVALRTLDYLKSEPELLPWKHFRTWIYNIATMLEASDLYGHFQSYVQNLVRTPFQQLNGSPIDSMSPTDILLHEVLTSFACPHGLDSCVNVARNFFNDWKTTGVFKAHLTLRYTYLCTAVARGTLQDWQYVLRQYTQEGDFTHDSLLLSALGCSTDLQLLKQLLIKCLDGTQGIPRSQTIYCVSAVSATNAGNRVALEFLVEHSSQLLESLPEDIANIVHMAMNINSRDLLDNQVPRLKEAFGSKADVLQQINAQESKARTRLTWMETHYSALQTWLTPKGA